jgi:hypothetical protein
MNWSLWIVIGMILAWILSESTLIWKPLAEGFITPQRSDIGLSTDGWGEDTGYQRDLRFTEAWVDLQGTGNMIDFCRAVQRTNQPDSRRMTCALGLRDGMSNREWAGPSTEEGFKWSRDDYWRPPASKGKRTAYCRILKDSQPDSKVKDTGEFASFCAVAGMDGFRAGDERDTSPPPAIQSLLRAYQNALLWWRWQDDDGDYVDNAVYERHGEPIPPSEGAPLRTTAARGFQFNRWSTADQQSLTPKPPLTDYLRWGEAGVLSLDQIIPPRQIRAFAAWIWWDAVEAGAAIWESTNGGSNGKKELVRLFAEGGGPDLPALPSWRPAQEVRPDVIQAVGQLTEPVVEPLQHFSALPSQPLSQNATYVWEIWDIDGRLVRLESGPSSLKAGTWQHVVVTTAEEVSWWPRWQLWLDGELKAEARDSRAIPAMSLSQNFLGRGFRGCIQDVRMYSVPMTAAKIKEAKEWSGARLHPQP